VLPFDNLSRDPDNAFFAEGVQDEILTRLAKVADLKVIARTSTQRFKSAPENLPRYREAARCREHSRRQRAEGERSGASQRAVVNALTNAHLWAEIYDRKLTTFSRSRVTSQKRLPTRCRRKLTGSEKQMMAAQPTTDTTAYDLYHKGRSLWEKRSGDNIPKAIAYYEQAIARDPNYALAYAGLAKAYILLPFLRGCGPARCRLEGQRRGTQSSPTRSKSSRSARRTGQGTLLSRDRFGRRDARIQRAIELNPNDATAHHWFGNDTLAALGRFEEAIAEGKRAMS